MKIKLKTIAFVIGFFIGVAWAWPIWGPAGQTLTQGGVSPERIARVLMPLTVWLVVKPATFASFVRITAAKLFRLRLPVTTGRLIIIGLALSFLPLLAGVISGNSRFFIAACVPLTISLLTLQGLVLLEATTFRNVVSGIGLSTTCFLLAGIATSGLEMTAYFGRPRMLLGFVHPLSTSSVILGSSLFFLLLFAARPMKRWTVLRWIAAGIIALILIGLLVVSQSRNILFFVLAVGIFVWIGLRVPWKLRFGIFVSLLLLPWCIYGFAALVPEHNPVRYDLDQAFSKRLTSYQSALSDYMLRKWYEKLLVSPSYIAETFENEDVLRGFAAVDSVYLSFLLNYGLLALSALIVMLIILGWRLANKRETILAFGVLCAVVLFFTFDAQGITISNLPVFLSFAYSARRAINLDLGQLESGSQYPISSP